MFDFGQIHFEVPLTYLRGMSVLCMNLQFRGEVLNRYRKISVCISGNLSPNVDEFAKESL